MESCTKLVSINAGLGLARDIDKRRLLIKKIVAEALDYKTA